MNWSRIGIVVLGSGWFFLVSCTAGLFVATRVVAQIDARDVSKGESVHSNFSIVLESSGDEPFSVVSLYDLTRYQEMAESNDEPFTNSYLMSTPGGRLRSDTSDFSYEIIEETASGQIIEVVEAYHDGDNTIWSRYEATRTSVTPISSRMFYFGYMFAAFPYAMGFGLLLYAVGRYLRHQEKKSDEQGD